MGTPLSLHGGTATLNFLGESYRTKTKKFNKSLIKTIYL